MGPRDALHVIPTLTYHLRCLTFTYSDAVNKLIDISIDQDGDKVALADTDP